MSWNSPTLTQHNTSAAQRIYHDALVGCRGALQALEGVGGDEATGCQGSGSHMTRPRGDGSMARVSSWVLFRGVVSPSASNAQFIEFVCASREHQQGVVDRIVLDPCGIGSSVGTSISTASVLVLESWATSVGRFDCPSQPCTQESGLNGWHGLWAVGRGEGGCRGCHPRAAGAGTWGQDNHRVASEAVVLSHHTKLQRSVCVTSPLTVVWRMVFKSRPGMH